MIEDKSLLRSPDFIGIGFRRCASSWLHQALSEHPQIGKPPNGLHFFSEEVNYIHGTEWYETILGHYLGRQVVGELSVSYGYPDVYQNVAKRINTLYPDTKIICTVRNPIARCYSDYRRSIVRGELGKSVTFEQALLLEPDFIGRGNYGKVLSLYNRYLGTGDLLVVFYEDLERDPIRYIQTVYRFLNVDDSYEPSNAKRASGHAALPKNYLLHKAIRNIQIHLTGTLLRLNLGGIVGTLRKFGIQNAIRGLNSREVQQYINPQTQQRLYEIYKDDINILAQITKKKLDHWRPK